VLFDTVTLENIVLTLLVGAVGWFALTIQNLTVKIATLSEKVAHLETNMNAHNQTVYSLKDAQKDLQLRDALIASLTLRVTALEHNKND
jgi:outer membrane murein-binding lipoprotein Lpp